MNVIFMDFGQMSIEGLGLPKGDLLTGEEKINISRVIF